MKSGPVKKKYDMLRYDISTVLLSTPTTTIRWNHCNRIVWKNPVNQKQKNRQKITLVALSSYFLLRSSNLLWMFSIPVLMWSSVMDAINRALKIILSAWYCIPDDKSLMFSFVRILSDAAYTMHERIRSLYTINCLFVEMTQVLGFFPKF